MALDPDTSDPYAGKFQIDPQSMTNWCWASVSVAICNFYDDQNQRNQQQMVAFITGNEICQTGTFEICNVTYDLDAALNKLQHLNNMYDNPLTPDQLIACINNGQQPVACQMSLPGIGGHTVVIVNAYTGPDGQFMVQAADPKDGSINTMTYDQFLNNFKGSGGSWERSYSTQ
jgi:hypothetical protein